MKPLLQMAIALVLVLGSSRSVAQEDAGQAEVMAEEVPAKAVESAVAAVAALGHEVEQGRYHVALERMNPRWKERYAQRVGGMKELERMLEGVAAAMVAQNITMLSFKPHGKPMAYGVLPGQKTMQVNGRPESKLVYTQWLVLVPTVSQFRMMHNQPGEPARWVRIQSTGYQVAVADRDKLDWTFIDGAGLTVNGLRSLFVTLPQDMKLPEVGKKEIR